MISLVLRSPFAEGAQADSRRGWELVQGQQSGFKGWSVEVFSPPHPPSFSGFPNPSPQGFAPAIPSPLPEQPLPPRRYQQWLSSAASALS